MLSIRDFFIYLFIMAGVTYLIRALPFVIFKGRITNRFVQSFLYYVPYAVLGAMTFPSILFSTGKPCGFHSRTYNSLRACIQGEKPYRSCGVCLPCKLLRDTYLSAYLNVGAGVLDSPPAKDVAYVLYYYLDIL